METQEKKQSGTNAKKINSFDFSKSEKTVQNITIPNSMFMAKWIDGQGYAIGIEHIQITKYHKTLESALNEIGYGVDKDEEEDEIMVKVGEFDYEMIGRIVKALMIIERENAKIIEELIENDQKNQKDEENN